MRPGPRGPAARTAGDGPRPAVPGRSADFPRLSAVGTAPKWSRGCRLP